MSNRRVGAKGLSTRARIVEAGAALIHAKGFNFTGVQEILDKAGVPKGSFYFYFDSKETLGLEIIDHHLAFLGAQVALFLGNRKVPPLIRLRRLFKWFQDYYAKEGFTRGCPIGNLTQEMSDLNPLFREKLHKAMESLAHSFAGVIDEARRRGEVATFIESDELARFIVASWQGALLLMKLSRTPASLMRMETLVFDHLLKPDAANPRSVSRTKNVTSKPKEKKEKANDALEDRQSRRSNR